MTEDRSARSPGLILGVVAFSVFVAADDLTVVSTMLRPIINDLGLVLPDGLGDAAWVVNAYLIAFVAIMPIAGKVSDVVGRRRSFAAAWALFGVGSVLIPLSVGLNDPFRWFLVGRVLTALGGGAMVPIALAVVGDAYPPGRRTRALGTLGGIETLGWVWGPLYGALLVRVASWQWQFWLNIPLAVVGLIVSWRVLDGVDGDRRPGPIDWVGAGLLTTALVSINVALLGGATVQSVTGLDELTGRRSSTVWAYPVAAVAALGYLWWQRRARSPLISPRLVSGRGVAAALTVNLVVGAGLVIAMVDVPIFVNATVFDLERAATTSGLVLSALTVAMAVASWAGGRLGERFAATPMVGLVSAAAAFVWMGSTWSSEVGWTLVAVQLALLGIGIGLTVAPTTAAVVDAAPTSERGAAAAVVMLARLMGLSIGLSALTAWALRRFDAARRTIDLPPIGSEGYEEALLKAQGALTATATAETFLAAAGVLVVGLCIALVLRRSPDTTRSSRSRRTAMTNSEPEHLDGPEPIDETEHLDRPEQVADPEEIVAAPTGELASLRRQLRTLTGALAVMLAITLVVVLVLVGRVRQANADASAAREQAARAESGAALYASQIDGFQQQLTDLQPELDAQLDNAIGGLRDFEDATITFPVNIDETVPIETEVQITRTIEVPIQLDVPIDETFDTTIQIDTPLGKVPLDVTVPVKVTVPIDETVSIPLDETVPIRQDVPIKLDVPVAIDVGKTELSALVASIAEGLESLQRMLNGLSSEPGSQTGSVPDAPPTTTSGDDEGG